MIVSMSSKEEDERTRGEDENAATRAEDMLSAISPFLDLHLLIPMLDWYLKERSDVYDADSVSKRYFELVKETHMVDTCMDLKKQIYGEDADLSELEQKKNDVTEKYHSLANLPALALLEDEDAKALSRQEKRGDEDESRNIKKETNSSVADSSDKIDPAPILERYNLSAEDVEDLYAFGKFMMSAGQYSDAENALAIYISMSSDRDPCKRMSALWGLLATQILGMNPSVAIDTVYRVRHAIDALPDDAVSPVEQLQHRAWLAHWSLFVFFQCADADVKICNFFLNTHVARSANRGRNAVSRDEYVKVVQNNCPWLLRYLVAAAVVRKWNRSIGSLTKIIGEEQHAFSDPLTRMLKSLYADYDLESTQRELAACETVVDNDYFFNFNANANFARRFKRSARQLIFRTFCLTHREINMKDLAERLQMDLTECEKWTVDLIQSNEGNKMLNDAKIDTERAVAIMNQRYPSVYEDIIQKTRELASRSFEMADTVGKLTG